MMGRLPLSIALFVLLVVGGGFLAFRTFLYAPPTIKAPPPPRPQPQKPDASTKPVPTVEPLHTVVLTTRGKVERQVGDTGWQGIKPGDQLLPEESIRTGAGAEVDLQIGDDSKILVAERSKLAVADPTTAVRTLTLKTGRIAVEHQGGSDNQRVLRIQDEEGKVLVSATAARFNVLRNGKSFVVATETGSVDLNTTRGTTLVQAGEQAIATPNTAPSPAVRISKKLLLKIAATGPGLPQGLCTVVKGKTDPGAELRIDGRSIPINARGFFNVPVPRTAGKNSVSVLTRDVQGRTQERTVACAPLPKEVKGMGVRWNVAE